MRKRDIILQALVPVLAFMVFRFVMNSFLEQEGYSGAAYFVVLLMSYAFAVNGMKKWNRKQNEIADGSSEKNVSSHR